MTIERLIPGQAYDAVINGFQKRAYYSGEGIVYFQTSRREPKMIKLEQCHFEGDLLIVEKRRYVKPKRSIELNHIKKVLRRLAK